MGTLYGTAAFGGLAGCEPDPYPGAGRSSDSGPTGVASRSCIGSTRTPSADAAFQSASWWSRAMDGCTGRPNGASSAWPPIPLPPTFRCSTPSRRPRAVRSSLRPSRVSTDGSTSTSTDGGDGLTNGVGSVYSMTKAGTDVVTHHFFTLSGGGQGPYGLMHQDSGRNHLRHHRIQRGQSTGAVFRNTVRDPRSHPNPRLADDRGVLAQPVGTRTSGHVHRHSEPAGARGRSRSAIVAFLSAPPSRSSPATRA